MEHTKVVSLSKTLKLVTGCSDWRDAASTIARELHSRLELGKPPFDPRLAAEKLGIRVVERPVLDDGFLTTSEALSAIDSRLQLRGVPEKYDAKSVIVVRDSLPNQRKRFIVAHELAHCMIRQRVWQYDPDFPFSCDQPTEEFLCNLVAADFLMPDQAIRQDLSEMGISASSLTWLRQKYDVSLQAILVRTAALFEGHLFFALHAIWPDGRPRLEFATPEAKRPVFYHQDAEDLVRMAFKSSRQIDTFSSIALDGTFELCRFGAERIHESERVLTFVEVSSAIQKCQVVLNERNRALTETKGSTSNARRRALFPSAQRFEPTESCPTANHQF